MSRRSNPPGRNTQGVFVITATPELADLFAKARDSFLSPRTRDTARASPSDTAVMQRFADTIAAMLDVAAQDLARGWSLLAAGQVDDPSKEGQVVLWAAERYMSLAASVEEGWRDLMDKGRLEFDSGNLVQSRQRLEREMDRYRREWPMISPDQIEAARRRYEAAGGPTFEEAARALGLVPEEAPRELAAPGWSHLVLRRHPWKRQPFIRGRNMTVRQLVGTVRVNGWSDEEAAQDLGCPPEAIREAIRYAADNPELLAAEAEYERLCLSRRGLRP
jgi:uncharacterized protein (DUF433 family)